MKIFDRFGVVVCVVALAGVAWAGYVTCRLHEIARTEADLLKEARIHTMYVRGAVPVASDPDRCGK